MFSMNFHDIIPRLCDMSVRSIRIRAYAKMLFTWNNIILSSHRVFSLVFTASPSVHCFPRHICILRNVGCSTTTLSKNEIFYYILQKNTQQYNKFIDSLISFMKPFILKNNAHHFFLTLVRLLIKFSIKACYTN